MTKLCLIFALLIMIGCRTPDQSSQRLKNIDGSVSNWEMRWPTGWMPDDPKDRLQVLDPVGTSYGNTETQATLYLADAKTLAKRESTLIHWSAKGFKKSDEKMVCVVFPVPLEEDSGTAMYMIYKESGDNFSLSMQTSRLYTREFAEEFVQEGMDLIKSASRN